MDERTLRALRGSIEKWERNLAVAQEGTGELNIDRDSCPLCALFWDWNWDKTCRGCPVFERTGLRSCHGTPYYRVEAAQEEEDRPALIAATEDEIAFLRSLLPPDPQT